MNHRTRVVTVAAVLGALVALIVPGNAIGRTGSIVDLRQAQYIVQVDPHAGDLPNVLNQVLASLGGRVDKTYSQAINGALVSLPLASVTSLLAVPGVMSVESNAIAHINSNQNSPGWGLDRIDQRGSSLNRKYQYTSTGRGVRAYIIDTGIFVGHADFGGRAQSGFDAVDGGPADDCNGHGTHVAGTVGGKTYGVAKEVSLVAVRVLDCDGEGTVDQILSGIEWVIRTQKATKGPAVANLSFGTGGTSSAMDTAVRNLIKNGVTVSVAAGNDSADACSTSPGRVAEVLTVAATDSKDAMASFSDGGTCVDLFAPGVDVTSAWSGGASAKNTLSGTSMAAPHVTGAVARYLQKHPSASPDAVASALSKAATTGVVTGTSGRCALLILLCQPATPNPKLLYIDRLS